MAKSNKKNKKLRNNSRQSLPLGVLTLVLFILLATLSIAFIKQQQIIGRYELLEKIDNQACRYLDNQPAVNGSFNLNTYTDQGEPQVTYTCLTGETTEPKEIHGKFIDKYNLGASVSYFSSNEEALKFAEENLNPLRYWGVDQEGQKNGIPQTSLFTFIVNDAKSPYFDAYTVKANAVLRVSLPCSNAAGDACYEEAESMLNRELKGINAL